MVGLGCFPKPNIINFLSTVYSKKNNQLAEFLPLVRNTLVFRYLIQTTSEQAQPAEGDVEILFKH